jgi:hypothetical protein
LLLPAALAETAGRGEGALGLRWRGKRIGQ